MFFSIKNYLSICTPWEKTMCRQIQMIVGYHWVTFYQSPKGSIEVMTLCTMALAGLLDRDKLDVYVKENAEKIEISQVVDLLKEGKIIGVVNGDSEIGPRALTVVMVFATHRSRT